METKSIGDRIPPHSLEYEQSLLGALMVDQECVFEVVDELKPGDFYKVAHQIIYKIIVKLVREGHPVNVLTVSESLKDHSKLDDVGGRHYVEELALVVVTTDGVPFYAKKILEFSTMRALVRLGGLMTQLGLGDDPMDVALDRAQQELFKVAQRGVAGAVAPLGDILPKSWELLEDRANRPNSLMGVSCGFYDLDNYLSGLQSSDLLILAARPSMGKTALALNIANHVGVVEKRPVLIFSLEMSKESLSTRLLCAHGEVDSQRVRSGQMGEKDFARLATAMGVLEQAPIFIDDSPGLGLMEMRSKARKLMAEHGTLGLIVVDYLQLMASPGGKGWGENRTQEISAISRGLKNMARELNAPVLALSQLSRAVEGRQDKRPMLSDLRESGSIEQDADVVMFIYRDEYYNPESDRHGVADVIIAKQRNGPVGTTSLIFNPALTRFRNMEERANPVF